MPNTHVFTEREFLVCEPTSRREMVIRQMQEYLWMQLWAASIIRL